MLALSPQDYAQERYGDARLETAVHVLVHSYAPADGHEEEHLDCGVTASDGPQALPARMGAAAQAALGDD